MIQEGNSKQIQVVLNRPSDEETTIDLGRVFQNMKNRRRLFAWVLVLCLTIGVCAPLLMYQFTEKPLTVSSVVTLRYEAPVKVREQDANGEWQWVVPEEPEYELVSDLSAPDGEELDLGQITTSYVLQNALDRLTLSAALTTSQVASNIQIKTLLTEESSRVKEALAGLSEAKNADAYNQLKSVELKYQNRFVVTLTNGFGDAESKIKINLKDSELPQLLDQILTVYNEYLVRTYADVKLPEDTFSMIDVQSLDLLDSLDQIKAGIQTLYDYCNGKTDTVKEYRSWQTGRNLTDWMEILTAFRSNNVDYLYATVSENAVTRDKTALLTSWRYLLRTTQNELEETNEKINETKRILASYKNDKVFISMQESDAAKTTTAATEYYNKLILEQTKLYEEAAKQNASIMDYEDRIKRLEAAKETEVTAELEEAISQTAAEVQTMYEGIKSHMEEVFQSTLYTTYEDHSAAQGKKQGFLAASAKKMAIGAAVGAILACGLWFLAALAPEFSRGRKNEEKEGTAK